MLVKLLSSCAAVITRGGVEHSGSVRIDLKRTLPAYRKSALLIYLQDAVKGFRFALSHGR